MNLYINTWKIGKSTQYCRIYNFKSKNSFFLFMFDNKRRVFLFYKREKERERVIKGMLMMIMMMMIIIFFRLKWSIWGCNREDERIPLLAQDLLFHWVVVSGILSLPRDINTYQQEFSLRTRDMGVQKQEKKFFSLRIKHQKLLL